VNDIMRSFAGAALIRLVLLSMRGAASAGPTSVSSGSAISAASPAQSRRFATTGGTSTIIALIGIVAINGIIVATTPGVPLLERPHGSW
jgi:type IV secretory pathway VirB2 component (pilin)